MSGTQTFHLAVSIGFAIAIVALLFVIFSPKTNSTHFYLSNTKHLDPKMVKVVNMIGGDLLSILPKEIQKNSIASKEVEEAFRASGNPWEVTKLEFFALRVSYGFIYGILGILFVFITRPSLFMMGLIIFGLGYVGWKKPLNTYRKIAEVKAKDFKKHFPEMLDYLTMIISSGSHTFTNSIEVVLPYLPKSAVKEEFQKVVDSINSGMSTEDALKELSNRLPSPALEAFINAVNNANALNTPMEGLLETRARKSREDLRNDLELIIQGLPMKTMLTVAPAAIISMLVIFMVPVINALMSTL